MLGAWGWAGQVAALAGIPSTERHQEAIASALLAGSAQLYVLGPWWARSERLHARKDSGNNQLSSLQHDFSWKDS